MTDDFERNPAPGYEERVGRRRGGPGSKPELELHARSKAAGTRTVQACGQIPRGGAAAPTAAEQGSGERLDAGRPKPHFRAGLSNRMKRTERQRALTVAVAAAQAAGRLMLQNARSPKRVNVATQHDLKLELDVRCQVLIQRRLRAAFPESSVWGEEGSLGEAEAPLRWVVDPIDGTVNFAYGIPHASVSIALQERVKPARPARTQRPAYQTIAGVVFDPFGRELWTAIRGGAARLNGEPIHVSPRRKLAEAVVSLGFGKQTAVLRHLLPAFNQLADRVRKLRIMGSAALALTYVASGRFDAFVELGLGWWDIAAGGLIVECAGGEFWQREHPDGSFEVIASNGRLRRALSPHLPKT